MDKVDANYCLPILRLRLSGEQTVRSCSAQHLASSIIYEKQPMTHTAASLIRHVGRQDCG